MKLSEKQCRLLHFVTLPVAIKVLQFFHFKKCIVLKIMKHFTSAALGID